jgi:nicotinate phosphoribosyltransferase
VCFELPISIINNNPMRTMMRHHEPYRALLTDLYQLTMDAAYLDNGKADNVASFEMFIRSLPKDWGYFIAAGIDETLDCICSIRFTDEDIAYLRETGLFKPEYLEYLEDYRFKGDIYAIREGTPFTAETPIVRVTAKRSQAQLVETILLNIVNYQTMIASKASRIVNAAGEAKVIDFGLRRAHGSDAGIKGARATYMAGVIATSNVEAGKLYGIPVSGTMAHSFVMGFEDEIDSFRAFAKTFPENTVLLIDTYDTLEGARKAAVVAKEMEAEGRRLLGVRLDSGDMEDLAEHVRVILDDEGLDYVKIVLSSDLNEYMIDGYTRDGAPVDYYGVGTEMITAKPVAALSGVYKLVEDNLGPRIKLSESKRTYPGRKQVYRVMDGDKYLYDVLELEGGHSEGSPLLVEAVRGGRMLRKALPIDMVRAYCLDCVSKLPNEVKKVYVEEPYQLRIGTELHKLTESLVQRYSNGG